MCQEKQSWGCFFFLLLCCTTEQWTVDCRFQRCLLVNFDWLMSVGKYEAVIMVFALRSGLPPSQHLQLEHLFVRADRNVFCLPRLFLRGVPQRCSSEAVISEVVLSLSLSHGLGPDQHQHQDLAGGSLVLWRGGWAMPESRLSGAEHLCRAWSWWAWPLLALVSSLYSERR